MAVKDWSFARLLAVLTLGSAATLGLGLATVGAYLGAPDNDPLVRFWEHNRWLLVAACVVFLGSVVGLYTLVAFWVVGRLRRRADSRQRPGEQHPQAAGPSWQAGRPEAPGLDISLEMRAHPGGRRLRWWEIAGLLAAVGAVVWARMYRRSISAEEIGVVVGIVVLSVVIARPWRAGGRPDA